MEAIREENTTEIARPSAELAIVRDDSDFSNILDTAKFNHMLRVADVFSKSTIVPEHFQGQHANCMIALQMAFRLDVDPMMFMQKSYVVHGKPGIESQLKIALANKRGPFSGPIQWSVHRSATGEIQSCTAWAKHARTGEKCEYTLHLETVKAEGWDVKKDKQGNNISKWRTMPEKMFKYRSASWLIDLYCPEVTLGLATAEELMEMDAARTVDVTAKVIPFQPPEATLPLDTPEPVDLEPLWAALYTTMPDEYPKPSIMDFVEATAKNQGTVADVLRAALDPDHNADFWSTFVTWQTKNHPSKTDPDAEADDAEPNKPADSLFDGEEWEPSAVLKEKLKKYGFDVDLTIVRIRDQFGKQGMTAHAEIEPQMENIVRLGEKKFRETLADMGAA